MMQRTWRGVAAALVVALVAIAYTPGPAAAKKPGLSVQGLSLDAPSAEAGSTTAVRGKLRSRRARKARPLLRLSLEPAAGERIQIAERRIRVKAGKKARFTLAGSIPAATPRGQYVASVCIVRARRDRCRQVGERLTVTRTGTSGARTLGDPLYPETGNGGYDVRHYEVELNWDDGPPESFEPGTKATITAQATQALSEFSLDLEGLTVGAVEVDGAPAGFTREAPVTCSGGAPCGPTKLVITPAASIDDGAQFTVEVSYTGDPLRHTDPDGADEGWADTSDGAFVVNEPVGAMTWMPCNNHPVDKATYGYELTVPTGKTALGNGELAAPPTDNGDGTTTWRWNSADPLSPYLSTATVGDFDFTETQTVNGLPIYEFIDSAFTAPQKAAADAQTNRQESITDYFTVLYGAYPFDSMGTVVDQSDVGYALEVQTKSHFPSATVNPVTLAHEVAHHWFGNSVTLTTWKDIWLNEGWAEWSEWIWDNEENSNPLGPAEQFDLNYTPGTKWNAAPGDPSAATLFDTFPTYVRPAMMLQALREIIGNAHFLTLARDWHASHRHGHGTTAQFIALSKQISGFSGAELDKLDTFFQQWLYGTTMPTITGDNF